MFWLLLLFCFLILVILGLWYYFILIVWYFSYYALQCILLSFLLLLPPINTLLSFIPFLRFKQHNNLFLNSLIQWIIININIEIILILYCFVNCFLSFLLTYYCNLCNLQFLFFLFLLLMILLIMLWHLFYLWWLYCLRTIGIFIVCQLRLWGLWGCFYWVLLLGLLGLLGLLYVGLTYHDFDVFYFLLWYCRILLGLLDNNNIFHQTIIILKVLQNLFLKFSNFLFLLLASFFDFTVIGIGSYFFYWYRCWRYLLKLLLYLI